MLPYERLHASGAPLHTALQNGGVHTVSSICLLSFGQHLELHFAVITLVQSMDWVWLKSVGMGILHPIWQVLFEDVYVQLDRSSLQLWHSAPLQYVGATCN